MIEIKYNVFDKNESIPCEEILCSAMISSADKTSCDVMYNILTKVFQNNKMIFRAIGLPHNMEDVLKIFENYNPKFFEGDSRKFYIRKIQSFMQKYLINQH